MKSKICLVQAESIGEVEINLAKAKKFIAQCMEEYKPGLIIFPEVFMSHYPAGTSQEIIRAACQPLDGPFVTELQAEAKKYGVWLIFGMSEKVEDPEDKRKYNTTVVINGEGEIVATYRKTHLYDAFGYKESDNNKPGDKFFMPIDTPFGKLGLFVCYEVRFPEVARYQRKYGADIIIMPTAWAEGKLKSQQFHTLINARAIENTVYMVACDLCGQGCLGESCVVDPMGVNIALAGETETILCAEIDSDRIEEVRKKLPAYKDRRPALYEI